MRPLCSTSIYCDLYHIVVYRKCNSKLFIKLSECGIIKGINDVTDFVYIFTFKSRVKYTSNSTIGGKKENIFNQQIVPRSKKTEKKNKRMKQPFDCELCRL